MSELAGDIARLRSEGMSDDKILDGYRTYSPDDVPDIDRLLSEGKSSKELVDALTTYQRGGQAPEPQDGALETTRKALQYGAANAAVGLGRTAHWLGEASGIDMAKSAGDAIVDIGRDIAPTNYRPAAQDFLAPKGSDKGLGGYGWGYIPRMILESAPGLAMDIGAGALTGGAGFVASNAARTFGPAVDARMENNGGREASATDYAVAAGSSALQAYLGKVGINPALSGVTKGAGLGAIAAIPGQVAKAGVVDGATGAAGALVDRAGITAGTDAGLSIDPHEAIGSAIVSGATGAGIRGVRGVGDFRNAIRYSDMDPQVAGRLATRIEKLGVAHDNPEGAFKAVKIADDILSTETSRIRNDYGMNVGGKLRDANAERMDSAEAMLSNGYALAPTHIAELRSAFADNRFGKRYVDNIEERSALNQLKEKGRFEDGWFAGGLSSSPIAEEIINPASWITNSTKRAIGGVGAMIGLGSELEAIRAIAAPVALAKAMAIQGAAHGGLRAVDGITGSRNPVKEFTGRFGGAAPHVQSRVPEVDKSPMMRVLSDAERAGVRDAVGKAMEAQGQPTVTKGGSEGSKAAGESLGASSERISPETIRIESGKYAVERAREDIKNVRAYSAATQSHLDTRARFGDDLEIAASGHEKSIEGLINKLNKQARSFDEATSMIEDAINELPWSQRSPAWDVFSSHEANLKGTWRI